MDKTTRDQLIFKKKTLKIQILGKTSKGVGDGDGLGGQQRSWHRWGSFYRFDQDFEQLVQMHWLKNKPFFFSLPKTETWKFRCALGQLRPPSRLLLGSHLQRCPHHGPNGFIVVISIIIIITRPKPAYGRQDLVGSLGQETDQAGTFWGVLNVSLRASSAHLGYKPTWNHEKLIWNHESS